MPDATRRSQTPLRSILGDAASKQNRSGPGAGLPWWATSPESGSDFMGPAAPAASSQPSRTADSAPIIDQHTMNHPRNWALCGLATLATTLRANGKSPNVDFDNTASINRFKKGIYHHGKGTSGTGMARRMRAAGLEDARFSTGGSVDSLMPSLADGKAMPVGFVSMGGEVSKLPNGSKRYQGLKEGDRHQKKFGEAGHWATVVGFDGPQEDPTHFLVNDSDTGAQIRMTTAEFEQHTKARDGIWDIKY